MARERPKQDTVELYRFYTVFIMTIDICYHTTISRPLPSFHHVQCVSVRDCHGGNGNMMKLALAVQSRSPKLSFHPIPRTFFNETNMIECLTKFIVLCHGNRKPVFLWLFLRMIRTLKLWSTSGANCIFSGQHTGT